MTAERLEEIRELMAALHFPTLGGVAAECRVCALLDSMGHGESTIACPSCACAELLAEVDRLRAAAELVQVALENNHMAMVVLTYGRELGLFTKE